jgi:tyrosine-protein phosphatase YwqE
VSADQVDAVVHALTRRGLRSVIAYAERHAHEDLADHLARLVDKGALVQVTAAMLAGDEVTPPFRPERRSSP